MIFSTEINGISSVKRIIEGDSNGRKKTATCRVWNDGDYFNEDTAFCISDRYPNSNLTLYHASGTIKKRVGRTYAVVPKRTKPGIKYKRALSTAPGTIGCKRFVYSHLPMPDNVDCEDNWREARIRILAMSKIDVRNMTEEQAYKEGFDSAGEYLAWWVAHYDRRVSLDTVEIERVGSRFPYKFTPRPDMLASLLKYRPVELYTGCFYEFELVEE